MFWTELGAVCGNDSFWSGSGAVHFESGTTYLDTSGAVTISIIAAAGAQKIANTSGACNISLDCAGTLQRVSNTSGAIEAGFTATASLQCVLNTTGAVSVGVSCGATGVQKVLNLTGALSIGFTIAATASGGGQGELPSGLNYFAYVRGSRPQAATLTTRPSATTVRQTV